MHTKDQLGINGENYAVRYLIGAGFTIVTRNWRCPDGEIDILAADGPTLAVIEVKTRATDAFGQPYEAVNWRKSARLRRLAAQWLREHPWPGPVRFDVISIVMPKDVVPTLQHIRAAF
ncbi:MAG TPA: YraN family protein [Mycobacteriales bacterium]|nr:YraN family protein [Mycobacteriales bacterium]